VLLLPLLVLLLLVLLLLVLLLLLLLYSTHVWHPPSIGKPQHMPNASL
jgi:hypothetical protein